MGLYEEDHGIVPWLDEGETLEGWEVRAETIRADSMRVIVWGEVGCTCATGMVTPDGDVPAVEILLVSGPNVTVSQAALAAAVKDARSPWYEIRDPRGDLSVRLRPPVCAGPPRGWLDDFGMSDTRVDLTFDDVLTVLLGLLGCRVNVGVMSASDPPMMWASVCGTLHAGRDLTGLGEPETVFVCTAEEEGSGFMLNRQTFTGAALLGDECVLIQAGDVGYIVDRLPVPECL